MAATTDDLNNQLLQLVKATKDMRDAIINGAGQGAAPSIIQARNNIRNQRGGSGRASSKEEAENKKRVNILRDENKAREAAKQSIDGLSKSLNHFGAGTVKFSNNMNEQMQRAFVFTNDTLRKTQEEAEKFGFNISSVAANTTKAFQKLAPSIFSSIDTGDVVETQQRIMDLGDSIAELSDVLNDQQSTAADLDGVLAQISNTGVDLSTVLNGDVGMFKQHFEALKLLSQHENDVGKALQNIPQHFTQAMIDSLTGPHVDKITSMLKSVGESGRIHVQALNDSSNATRKQIIVTNAFSGAASGAVNVLKQFVPMGTILSAVTRLYEEQKTALKYGSEQAGNLKNMQAAMMGLTKEQLAQLQSQNRQLILSSESQQSYTDSLQKSTNQFFGYIGDLGETSRAMTELRGSLALVGDTSQSVSSQADDAMRKMFVGVPGVSVGLKTLGWSVEDFTQLMQEYAKDDDLRYVMQILPANQRKTYMESITQQVALNQAMGMSKDQATAAAKALGKLGAEKPGDRLKKAYKLAALAGAYGVSGGQEYIQASMRNFTGAGDQETATKYLANISNATTKGMSQGFGAEMTGSQMVDKLGLNDIVFKEFNTTMGGNLKVTEDLIKSQQALQEEMAKSRVAETAKLAQQAGSLSQTGVGLAATGALAFAAGKLNLGKIIGKGIAPSVATTVENTLSGTPGAGAAGGRVRMGMGRLAGAGVGAVGGMALGYLGDKATEQGHEKLGAGLSIGSSALSGAAMGALAGPIGAAIGGVLGAAWGTYENWGQLTGSEPKEGQTEETKQQLNSEDQIKNNTQMLQVQQEQTDNTKMIAGDTSKTALASMSVDKKFDALLDLNKQSLETQKTIGNLLAMSEEERKTLGYKNALANARASALTTRYAQQAA